MRHLHLPEWQERFREYCGDQFLAVARMVAKEKERAEEAHAMMQRAAEADPALAEEIKRVQAEDDYATFSALIARLRAREGLPSEQEQARRRVLCRRRTSGSMART